jgi:hypothetical protein
VNTDKPIHQCIKDKDPICVNCKYYINLAGVGFGMRCSYNFSKKEGELPEKIPSRYHSCEHFKLSKK